jgi:hypothetical protein
LFVCNGAGYASGYLEAALVFEDIDVVWVRTGFAKVLEEDHKATYL